jgi:hypothetical protein
MTEQSYDQLCESVTPLLQQNQRRALFNIPPPRLNIVSPYPLYSPFQLNMRRKAEILKYNSSQQNTKSNNPTKKQKFANLVKKTGNVSQYQANLQTYSNLVCQADIVKPTLSTSCNVPGPPIMLQYDPTIPLYNYGNYKDNRSYAITNKVSDAIYNAYNLNTIEFFNNLLTTDIVPDAVLGDNIELGIYTFTGNLGSLIIGNNLKETTYSFNILTPMAIWFYGFNRNNDNHQVELSIRITEIVANIYYNDVLVTSAQPENLNFISVECDTSSLAYGNIFYAIQYVGMLRINNLVLQTPPNTVYSIKYVAKYEYNSFPINNRVEFIKTGLFANLQTATSDNYIYNCSLVPSSLVPSSLNDFSIGSFSQFIVS